MEQIRSHIAAIEEKEVDRTGTDAAAVNNLRPEVEQSVEVAAEARVWE